MKKILLVFTLLVAFLCTACAQNEIKIKLSDPVLDGTVSIEKVLNERRSVRAYKDTPLTEQNLSQLLWAGQGITDKESKKRTAPSARAKYPIELYVVVFNVEGIEKGVYLYVPDGHGLAKVFGDEKHADIIKAAGSQGSVSKCAAAFIIASNYKKMNENYNERDILFTHTEVGHVSQNIALQGVALNIGSVVVGGFQPDNMAKLFDFPEHIRPVYVMPVGNN